MKHLGDITKLNGSEIPVVDVITGGSPCQDLSVAGKRAGLAGERSGLFMEQIRIVKEMREKDVRSGRNPAYARPRYMVWENVPGAFSSGNPKGADFAAVLEEIIKVAEPGADVCVCVPDGRWTKSGCYYAEDGTWSIAWRVHDAQFWGVPQRRKRIALVADFGGLSAPEVLFERKGLSRDSEQGGKAGKGTPGAAGGCVEGASGTISFQERGGKPGGGKGILIQHEHVGALSTLNNQSVLAFDPSMSRYAGTVFKDVAKTLTPGTAPGHHDAVAYGISAYDSNAMKSPNPHSGIYEADTARTLDLNGGSPACNQGGIAVVQSVGCDVYNQEVTGEVAASLTAASGGTNTSGPKVIAINGEIAGTLDANYYKGGSVMDVSQETAATLRAQSHGHQPVVAFTQNQRNEVRDLGDIAGALAAEPGVHQQTYVYENHSQDSRYKPLGEVSETVSAKYGTGGNNQPLVVNSAVCVGNGQLNQISMAEQANTLDTMHDQQAVIVFDKEMYNCGKRMQGEPQARFDHVSPTVRADSHPSGVCTSTVRRLTPMECERLQGYPDGWTDIGDWVDSKGKKHKASDSPRYKALGNSIALPFWFWLLRRISAQYERPATLGSLFDGIGGFPLCWERCNGKGTALWASEIEEFPIAVTKIRFSETKGATNDTL